MARAIGQIDLVRTRLANTYGGWVYCGGCKKTIGYLCYVTYDGFCFDYTCSCGNIGHAYIAFEGESMARPKGTGLITIKNRLCCPSDKSPLVTVIAKNLKEYRLDIICKACHSEYLEGQ